MANPGGALGGTNLQLLRWPEKSVYVLQGLYSLSWNHPSEYPRLPYTMRINLTWENCTSGEKPARDKRPSLLSSTVCDKEKNHNIDTRYQC